jgi:hypothetical protein
MEGHTHTRTYGFKDKEYYVRFDFSRVMLVGSHEYGLFLLIWHIYFVNTSVIQSTKYRKGSKTEN